MRRDAPPGRSRLTWRARPHGGSDSDPVQEAAPQLLGVDAGDEDALAAPAGAGDDPDPGTGDAERLGEKGEEGAVGGALHGGCGNADADRLRLQTLEAGLAGAGRDDDREDGARGVGRHRIGRGR